ncbi:MAG: hypothetical protein HQK55_11885 [Deltaproteobacteria bacterium]|nr:hypothetical protein [Deltaproteobacteria bacterium]
MKNIFSKLMVLFFFLIMVACGSDTSGLLSSSTTTVLVYMEGTDLEATHSQGLGNIKEMLTATGSPLLTVILTTGAADKAVETDPIKSWRTVKRHLLRNKILTELQDLGNLDMGNPEVLTDFIIWAQTSYPADRYLLVLWDHGGGALGGFGGNWNLSGNQDPSFPVAKSMNINDLRKGVGDAVIKTGRPFELIGFDACLMSTLEVAFTFKDYAKYLAASEDIEPGTGWDWQALLNYIAANPKSDGAAIGQALADGYYAKNVRAKENDAVTFSITELAKIPQVSAALGSFSKWQRESLAANGLSAWEELAFARSRSLDFYTSNLELTNVPDMTDLVDLVEREALQAPQTSDLVAAVKNAVVYKVAGPLRMGRTWGLSLMFPSIGIWSDANLELYASFPFVPEYQALVAKFASFGQSRVPNLVISTPLVVGNTVSADITPLNAYYEQAYLAMTDGNGLYYGHQPLWSSFPNKLEYSWDGRWFTLNGLPVSIMAEPSTEAGVTLKIPMYVKYKGIYNKGIYFLRHDYATGQTTELGFQPLGLNNQAYTYSRLEAGAEIWPLDFETDDGVGKRNKSEQKFVVPESGLVFDRTTLTAGNYQVAFILYDLRLKPFSSTTVTFTN